MKFLVMFLVLSLINVVFSTIRSITTIKSGKTIASLISGGYFAFYNIMLVYTVADFPMWQKCVITFICNVIGVYAVKLVEEKSRKDKLWLVKVTIPKSMAFGAKEELTENNISYSVIDTNGFKVFDCYCATQNETTKVLEIAKKFDGKTFATENKLF